MVEKSLQISGDSTQDRIYQLLESNAMILQKVELSSQYDWIFQACNISKQREATLIGHVRKGAMKGRALGNVTDSERLQLGAFFNTMAHTEIEKMRLDIKEQSPTAGMM